MFIPVTYVSDEAYVISDPIIVNFTVRTLRWIAKKVYVPSRRYLSGHDDMAGDEKREQSTEDISTDSRVVKIIFSIDGFNDFQ
ncbi:MAG: hypothetical protein WA869_31040 [Alloacidobacterium sp.]|jgi:hypothetical protein